MKEKKYHYVYQVTYPDNKKYIGVRSCDCEIEDDPYMGSPFHLPEELEGTGTKEVLGTFSTRAEAMKEEIRLHALYDVRNNSEYYNQCNSTTTKFMISREAAVRSGITRTGRTKHTHEYIAKQVEARKKYKGEQRTEAQKAQFAPENLLKRKEKYMATLAKTMEDPVKRARIEEARIRGGKWGKGRSNPKKANIGLKHGASFPWFYKTPEGKQVEVYDSIRNFYVLNPDTLPFTKDRVMAYIREGVPTKISNLGWDFGRLANRRSEPVEQ